VTRAAAAAAAAENDEDKMLFTPVDDVLIN